MAEGEQKYTVNLDIDYPAGADRLTSFFRALTVLPILIILGLMIGVSHRTETSAGLTIVYSFGGVVFIPTLLMIVFRQKYPKWWYDWNLELTRFATRVSAYFLLLRHEYPSTDEEQSVHIQVPYPDAKNELQRGMPLVKWFLVIPHVIVLYFLYIIVIILTVIAWFAILFTGKYPKGFFEFVVGVMRWSLRVFAYSILLTTDVYPPFRLS